MSNDTIQYSDKYNDDKYEYRLVCDAISKQKRRKILLLEYISIFIILFIFLC